MAGFQRERPGVFCLARRPLPESAELYLRPPSGGRKTFAIIRRVRKAGTSQSETVSSSVIDTVNRQLKAGLLSLEKAHEACRRELKRLKSLAPRKRAVNLRPANLKLLEEYWERKYKGRKISAPKAAWDRLRRSVEALGDTPLTASEQELQAAIDRATEGRPKRQRVVVSALRQILRWMGRTDVNLHTEPKPLSDVSYLGMDDFTAMQACLRGDEMKILAWIAMTTGCRVGEIFAIKSQSYRASKQTLWVDRQIKIDGKESATKNRRPREVPVLPEGIPWLEKWFSVSKERKAEIRRTRFADEVKRACMKAFPKAPENWIKFHDLRHSYAIHLLNRGVPIGLVAQALGDSIVVTQENYVGFCLTDDGISTVQRLLNRAY